MRSIAMGLGAALTVAATAVQADTGLLDRSAFQGQISLGLATSDGLTSGSRGGFGKTSVSGGAFGDGRGELVWRPQLNDSFSLVVDAVAQPGTGRAVDAAEAYLLYKPVPTSNLRVQGRGGLLYPPVSLEHNAAPGEPWTVRDTLTASAINSWVGEEVKVLGVEAAAQRRFASVRGIPG